MLLKLLSEASAHSTREELLDKSWNICLHPTFNLHFEYSNFSRLSYISGQGVPGVSTPHTKAFLC